MLQPEKAELARIIALLVLLMIGIGYLLHIVGDNELVRALRSRRLDAVQTIKRGAAET